jgi:hypothetical protein
MWFGLLDQQKASSMLNQLSSPDHETDWGMRIISDRASRYDAGGYHYGSVWPLFTGWASVGEYRYHRAFPAYSNLRSNALLALDGSLGHVAEVLSGDYYQPLSTNSPHQIWSAAMVISPLLRGLFGLQTDAVQHKVVLSPHVPADWTSFAIHNVHAGDATVDFAYRKTVDGISLQIESSAAASLEFSPALSPRARIISAELNGNRVPFQISKSDADQHCAIQANIPNGKSTLRIKLKNDFGISYASFLPPLGSPSLGLRLISDSWSASGDEESLEFAGAAGARYQLGVWDPAETFSVDGATIKDGKLVINIPASPSDTYPHQKVVIHFAR